MNVIVDVAPGASLSLAGLTCNQGASGGTLAVHVIGSAPGLVTTTDCGVETVPLTTRKKSRLLLTRSAGDATGEGTREGTGDATGKGTGEGTGDATWIVIGIVVGLPGIAAPVSGSIALTTTVVVYVVPPARPIPSTITFTSTFAPPARTVLGLATSLTKLGASGARPAIHLSGALPVFEMVNVCVATPAETLKTSEPGSTERVGGVSALSVTPTVCGLPLIAMP